MKHLLLLSAAMFLISFSSCTKEYPPMDINAGVFNGDLILQDSQNQLVMTPTKLTIAPDLKNRYYIMTFNDADITLYPNESEIDNQVYVSQKSEGINMAEDEDGKLMFRYNIKGKIYIFVGTRRQ